MSKVYRRISLGPELDYLIAPEHLYSLLFRPGDVSSHIVLRQTPGEEYLVVDMHAWHSYDWNTELSAEQAMHRVAQKFDTLEQAMLYFEMVRT